MAKAATPRDLFRAGNATSARFHILRPGEVATFSHNGRDWVQARSGGASTLEQPLALRGTWYLLPAGTAYDDAVFFLNNDYAGHWAWEPAQNLLLADYIAALAAINQEFIRV